MNFDEEAIKVIERIAANRNLPELLYESDEDPAYDIIADALEDAYEKGYAQRAEDHWVAPFG